MQLSYIDQNIQKILYHIKSKNLHDDYRVRPSSTKDIINQALKEYAVFFSYKMISLDLSIEDHLIDTDEKWCTYIISQLISNAVKYTDNGGSISISVDKVADIVTISIRNTGRGITQSEMNRIFKKGYASYNTRADKSTGYGLYLSHKLATIMGHTLSVESVENEYALFTLSLRQSQSDIHITKM